jgi:hypothetical protein
MNPGIYSLIGPPNPTIWVGEKNHHEGKEDCRESCLI